MIKFYVCSTCCPNLLRCLNIISVEYWSNIFYYICVCISEKVIEKQDWISVTAFPCPLFFLIICFGFVNDIVPRGIYLQRSRVIVDAICLKLLWRHYLDKYNLLWEKSGILCFELFKWNFCYRNLYIVCCWCGKHFQGRALRIVPDFTTLGLRESALVPLRLNY